MGRQGRYRPVERYRYGEAVRLKDGRSGAVVVDDAHKKEVLVRFHEGPDERLSWDLVEYVPPKAHFTYEQWQGLGNDPSCVPKR